MKAKLNHIALKVRNLKKAEGFYSQILRLKLVDKRLDKKGKIRSLWYDLDGTILMVEKTIQKKLPKIKNNGWHMIALTIKTNERNKWVKHLTKNRVKIIDETEYTIYVNDPEKNMIGLSHFPKKMKIFKF